MHEIKLHTDDTSSYMDSAKHYIFKVTFALTNSLCSKSFQNVKLGLDDFVEIWPFYRHSDFTWNPILANSDGPKMSFLAILETLNFDFWYI